MAQSLKQQLFDREVQVAALQKRIGKLKGYDRMLSQFLAAEFPKAEQKGSSVETAIFVMAKLKNYVNELQATRDEHSEPRSDD